ncbi:MAG: 50S ribosomal protein L22 [Candidatus Omnitrophota bacterium]
MELVGKAVSKYLSMSPYKVRKVVALIKGKDVNSAMAILKNTDKKASLLLERTLKSAIASAKQAGNIKQEELYVSRVMADDGPMMRRYRAAAMGRATMIRKRTSHILIELSKRPILNKKVSASARG